MLGNYLIKYSRNIKIPVFYDDLLRFQGSTTVYDKNDQDTFMRLENDQITFKLSTKLTHIVPSQICKNYKVIIFVKS